MDTHSSLVICMVSLKYWGTPDGNISADDRILDPYIITIGPGVQSAYFFRWFYAILSKYKTYFNGETCDSHFL